MEARISPMDDLLKGDKFNILKGSGVLSRLWRLTLLELKVGPLRWHSNLEDYIDKCRELYPDENYSNAVGNLGKALAKETITWDVLCKGISILRLNEPSMVLKLQRGGEVKTVKTDIKFTPDGTKCGITLKTLWSNIIKAYPEIGTNWNELCQEYVEKVNANKEDKNDSLRSNLTSKLKTKSITWANFVRGLQVAKFDAITVSLKFKTYTGDKSIELVLTK